jgi:seryl-tRNA synthetase
MIDIKLAREDGPRLRAALSRKSAANAALFDELMEADGRWREQTSAADALRARKKFKGRPSPEELEELGRVNEELQALEAELTAVAQRRDELLAAIPNPPEDDAPSGAADEDALELRRVGTPPTFSFAPKDHVDLGGFEMERGARLSGSRFAYRVGGAALLELSLYRYALDVLVREGFVPMLPPILVREQAMFGTGFLPAEQAHLYTLAGDDLYLTGTSEVALAGYHMGEIFSADEVPRRYAGYSTCFRRESGAAGRDTRGIFRVHQFDKVEMFVFCEPAMSRNEHERLLALEESIVQSLEIPYRVVDIAAGDLGPSAARKFDIEAWIPSQERYREITSCSNTTDYQARRLQIRLRTESGTLVHPHTLNGTAATGRFVIAIMENFQDDKGVVTVPSVLVPYGAPETLPPPT